jgi:hypothetical protein
MVFYQIIIRKAGDSIGAGAIVIQRSYTAFFLAAKLQFIGVVKAGKGGDGKGFLFEYLSAEIILRTEQAHARKMHTVRRRALSLCYFLYAFIVNHNMAAQLVPP